MSSGSTSHASSKDYNIFLIDSENLIQKVIKVLRVIEDIILMRIEDILIVFLVRINVLVSIGNLRIVRWPTRKVVEANAILLGLVHGHAIFQYEFIAHSLLPLFSHVLGIVLLWPCHLNVFELLILSQNVWIHRLSVFVAVLVLLLVKPIAGVLHRQDIASQQSSEVIEQLMRQNYVLCVSMEIYQQLRRAHRVRQIQARYEMTDPIIVIPLKELFLYQLLPLLNFDLLLLLLLQLELFRLLLGVALHALIQLLDLEIAHRRRLLPDLAELRAFPLLPLVEFHDLLLDL